MRLAIVRTSSGAVNIQSYNVQEIGLAKALLNFGISTDYYSIFENIETPQTLYERSNCKINLIPIKGISFLDKITYFHGLNNIIAKGNYDIVQVHEDSQLMTPIILKKCRKQNITTVLYQGMYADYKGVKYLYQFFLDLFFRKRIQKNANFILAKTSLAKKYLEKKNYKNIVILPIGLDEIEKSSSCLDATISNFKSQFKNLLLYVGKIEKRRNPFFLIDILQNVDLDTAMIVIGNGPLQEQMKDYATQKNVTNRLLMVNSVPNNEMHEIYKACDIFLLPTNYEIYGMVIMEALYNGIPVISTPEAGPLTILTDEKLGVCLPLNITKWIDKIYQYLNGKNIDIASYRSEIIKKNFNWNTIAKQYYSIITR